MKAYVIVQLTAIAACIALLLACPTGAVSPQGVTAIGLGVKDAICVVDHDNESVLDIIKDCNLAGDVAQEVSELLASTHAAEHRFAATADAGRDALGK